MYRFLTILAALTFAGQAQQAGPALSINAGSGQHVISPDIYGINFFWTTTNAASAMDIRPTVRRWGGNNTSTYHWKFDVSNIDADWFFEVLPDTKVDASKLPAGGSFNQFADQARTTGGKLLGTIPVLGWLPKARIEMCSFNQAKYPNQCKIDPFYKSHPYTCGDGIAYTSACGDPTATDGKQPTNPTYIKNDPTDAYAQFDQSLQAEWIRYLITRYGKGNQGGIGIWSLDNEPIWWDSTHRDIHPNPYTYDELLSTNMTYAQAIKQADPTALVAGPVSDNWASLWFSKADIVAGWAKGNYWSNPVDRNAHSGMALMPWYLQQFQNYEKQNGTRLLDYLDMHAYIEPSAVDSSVRPEPASVQALRLAATREFWDPTYVVTGDYWIKDVDNNGANIAPQLIPRVKAMIAQYYPGTRLGITEYNFGGFDTLNGAMAQADLLGIFGREGLDLATLWGQPKPTDPVAFAFRMYRNFDGLGGAFGETAVPSVSNDQSQLAVYGALRSDGNLTAMVINKTGGDLGSTLTLSGFTPGGAAKVWQYSGANLGQIVQQADASVNGQGVTAVFPANSLTMLVIPPASAATKPGIAAVTSAASYQSAIAPGQMVVVWGTGLGPVKLAAAALDANGLVSTSVQGVRILFDGVPAPIVYATATQSSAVVPYFGATKATTHVQVEYQGVRSDPLEVPVSATAPGLFTADLSGKGQGAVLNQDGVTRNSLTAAAHPGSVVVLWGTGEGVTDPPGVDGRFAVEVLPKPIAPVTVDIGGLPATVQYAGAAPGNIPGLFQVNAVVPANITPGDAVPVHVKIGGQTSQDAVTIVVR